jgi:hypothetical protein
LTKTKIRANMEKTGKPVEILGFIGELFGKKLEKYFL